MKDHVVGNAKEFALIAKKLGYSEVVSVSDSKRIFKSSPKDRLLIESKKAEMIYEFEQEKRNDPTHFRNSGMNHIIAKLMKENNVAYGLSFYQILHASEKDKAVIIGRIMQNLRLCRKYGVKVVIASFARNSYDMRDFKDLEAFSRILGK